MLIIMIVVLMTDGDPVAHKADPVSTVTGVTSTTM